MTRAEQQELKRIVDGLRNWYRYESSAVMLEDQPQFMTLEHMANMPREQAGTETNLQNMTDFTWERLISMRDEAQRINDLTEQGNLDPCDFPFVIGKLNEEIQRRLLKTLA